MVSPITESTEAFIEVPMMLNANQGQPDHER
jgi:hypothetical protein